jgi:hypothetical protein
MLCEYAGNFQDAEELLTKSVADIVIMKVPKKGIAARGLAVPWTEYSYLLLVHDRDIAAQIGTYFKGSYTVDEEPPYSFGFPPEVSVNAILKLTRQVFPNIYTDDAWIDATIPTLCRDMDVRFPSLNRSFMLWKDDERSSVFLFAHQHRGFTPSLANSRKICHVFQDTMKYKMFCPNGRQVRPKKALLTWQTVFGRVENYLQTRGLTPI